MKITSLEITPANKYLFIRINTDEGVHGTGEAGAWGFLDGVEGVLRCFENYPLGKNPFQIEHHWNYLCHSTYFRGSVIMSALPAIDIAFWDIKGEALGASVCELLGERCQGKTRSYEAIFCYTSEEMAEPCVNLKQKGYDTGRLTVAGDITRTQADRSFSIYNSKVEGYTERVRACWEAARRDFGLVLECHRSMDPREVIALAKGVEVYRPLFLEDPIPPNSLEAMADVARGINIPVATRERFINIQEFEIILQKQAVRYLRPDVCALGGLAPSKKVAAMVEANYAKIMPHNPLGSVSTAAYLQLDAAIPNFAIQGLLSFYHQGNEAEMTTKPLREEDGYIMIPDAPGIGIELAENPTEEFPPRQRNISVQTVYNSGVYDVQWNRFPKSSYYNIRQHTS